MNPFRKKAAALLAVFVFVGIICWLFASERKNILRESKVSQDLLLSYQIGNYSWLSQEKMLISYRQGDKFEVVEFDAKETSFTKRAILSDLLTQIDERDVAAIPTWRVSFDGGLVAVIDNADRQKSLTMFDLAGERVLSTYSLNGFQGNMDISWMPDCKRWLAYGNSNGMLAIVLLSADSKLQIDPVPLAQSFPLGFNLNSNLVVIGKNRGEGFSKIDLSEFMIQPTSSLQRVWEVQLPFHCQIEQVKLAPSGSRILWQLSPSSMVTGIRRISKFPYVTFSRAWRNEPQVWVSNTDGSSFEYFGDIPREEGGLLNWLPDESAISIIARNRLYIIPMPKD